MTFVFIVCWLPFLVLILLSDLCNFDTCPDFTTPEFLMYGRLVTTCLAFLNSAINPWIYGYRSAVIRVEMRALLRGKRTSVVAVMGIPTVYDVQQQQQMSLSATAVAAVAVGTTSKTCVG